ncbi:aspartyl protease family protein [Providencia sp. PROV130]|uniref:aspartyl protease family protein n=1 Tax=Providencia sp. PROV130 TaxID=2949840 RepID=UPI002349EA72|nr:aspartyl protease family protein [Providencia sp. PROV130]
MIRVLLSIYLLTNISFPSEGSQLGVLSYNEIGIPIINLEIENKKLSLMLDTGSSEGLHLENSNIKKIFNNKSLDVKNKTPYRYMDILGNENNVTSWTVDKLSISNVTFNNVKIVELQPWGLNIGEKIIQTEVVGLGIFYEKKIILDFKKNKLIILKDTPEYTKNWSSYPIEQTESGLKITAYAQNKPLNFIIDTAASHSIVFSSRLSNKNKYLGCNVISSEALNSDCNVQNILIRDVKGNMQNEYAIAINSLPSKNIEFDGLLGMSFMKNKIILIDLAKKVLYIQS